jgi:Na+-transporting NADH:ubiquinone oxidoreductase subunit B
MNFLRNFLEKQGKNFQEGGKFPKLFPLFEAIDTLLFTSGKVTQKPSHVRDALDLKRMMLTVIYALIPAVIMALYNTGLQSNIGIASISNYEPTGWQQQFFLMLGLTFEPTSILSRVHPKPCYLK